MTQQTITLRTFGQLLDEYLSDIYTVETVVLYHDKNANPHIVVTISESQYDWTEVFSEDHDLNADIAAKKKEVESLKSKIRALEKDKKNVENAIKKIARYK